MTRIAALLIACAVMLMPARAAGLDDRAAGEAMTNYYVTRDAAQAEAIVRWMAAFDYSRNKNAMPPATGFLAGLFAENPAAVRGWVSGLKPVGDAREVIERALWLSGHSGLIKEVLGDDAAFARDPAPSLLQLPLNTPSSWDMLWGAFSATGNTAYPARLIDLLDDGKKIADDPKMDFVFHRTVAWSLESNARQHERISQLLHREAAVRSGSVQDKLKAIITKLDSTRGGFTHCDGDFCADLVLIGDDNLPELDRPANEGPVLNARDKAKTGDKIVALVVFGGMKLTDDLSADVTYDCVVTRPDGKPYSDGARIGLAVLKGKVPMRFNVWDSRPALLMLRFEDKDLRGKYRIDVTVHDNIGKWKVTLSKEITLE